MLWHDIMCVLLMEVCMNFDYIRMLTIAELNEFITKALSGHFKTNLLVKPTNVKIGAIAQEIEFEAFASNGKYLTGKAVCGNFDCVITLNEQTIDLTYNKEWANWMYKTLKTKDFNSQARVFEVYKADYNDYRAKVRDDKQDEAEQEFETTLLR